MERDRRFIRVIYAQHRQASCAAYEDISPLSHRTGRANIVAVSDPATTSFGFVDRQLCRPMSGPRREHPPERFRWPAQNSDSKPIELLEAHGERLDGEATGATRARDQALAPVGALDRTTNG